MGVIVKSNIEIVSNYNNLHITQSAKAQSIKNTFDMMFIKFLTGLVNFEYNFLPINWIVLYVLDELFLVLLEFNRVNHTY